jgi:oligopeptide transport system substrate-binding protein
MAGKVSKKRALIFSSSVCVFGFMVWIGLQPIWNNPYPIQGYQGKVFYTTFQSPPKTLDVARSYSVDSSIIVNQIAEPLYEYHYFKRPYQLQPLLASSMPLITYLDGQKKPFDPHVAPHKQAVWTQFDIQLKQGILYHRHVALAQRLSHAQRVKAILGQHSPYEGALAQQVDREVTAEDFVYEIKRLADPKLQSPIFPLMAQYLVGLDTLRLQLQQAHKKHQGVWLDLRRFKLPGAVAVNAHHLRLTIRGQYPNFKYWLAMAFFAPIPWEVDQFYADPKMRAQQFDWNHWPIGTGPYYLDQYIPNRLIALTKNGRYRPVFFPSSATNSKRWVHYQGKKLPMIDHYVFSLEKEMIPAWHKFLQGYYDLSGVGNSQFDHAIAITAQGIELTEAMRGRQLHMRSSISPDIYYLGMNMHDPVVGGYSQKAKWLRQAIALGIDYDEYIALFANGRGLVAQSPIPPSIYKSPLNRVMFMRDGEIVRKKPLAQAQALLAKSGYPHGIDPKTGKPLMLYFDTVAGNGPDSKARLDWYRKQFSALGISLNVRVTQYNRFQDKVRQGQVQLFQYGWVADYPDAENFLFLFFGPNNALHHQGVNYSNFHDATFDRAFKLYQKEEQGGVRANLVQQMVHILYQQTPWVWGYHSKNLTLYHHWMYPIKPSTVIYNRFKYYDLDVRARERYQKKWNRPNKLPLILAFVLLFGLVGIGLWRYRVSQQQRYIDR